MANKDNSKQWFETGDYPTQTQFYQVFDWLRWKDEAIAITDITGLQEVINTLSLPLEVFTASGGDFAYTIPAGYMLEKVLLKAGTDTTVSAETAANPGSGDIVFAEDMTAADGAVWVLNKMAWTDLNIVIKGMPVGSKIYCVKRKIA